MGFRGIQQIQLMARNSERGWSDRLKKFNFINSCQEYFMEVLPFLMIAFKFQIGYQKYPI